jgi:23S rRNA (guanosine2251-2'-O)-methyltransferase
MKESTPEVIVIAHDLRSNYNVGSILRTCDGLGVAKFVATGTTPFPRLKNDDRLPHVSKRADEQIAKTALGAEQSVKIQHGDIFELINELKTQGIAIYGLEQANSSVSLSDFKPVGNFALIVGSEPVGINVKILTLCDQIIEIPMKGKKESFNVSVAAAIALWHLTN